MKVLCVIFLLIGMYGYAQNNYCIALRGNGELIPAHWGALAHTIETFGTPSAMAGGSSASISTFLVDNIFKNPILQSNKDSKSKAIQAAFLIKSIEGYFYARLNQPEWKSFVQVVKGTTNKETSLLKKLDSLLENLSFTRILQVRSVLIQIKESKVFYGPAIEKLFNQLRKIRSFSDWELFKEYSKQARISISLIGKFDANHDANLLIRDGVINFSAMSEVYSGIASFYSLYKASPLIQKRFSNYLQMCSLNSVGHTWQEITKKNPFCQTALELLTVEYFKEATYPKMLTDIIEMPMGRGLDVIVTAGFVRGDSIEILQNAKVEFEKTFSESAGDVRLNESDIYFGYAGTQSRLDHIQRVFEQKDLEISQIDKSQRFLPMGHTTWRQALAFSANEPGLGAFTSYNHHAEAMLSIGGWSDLHPTLILKASGCEKVVYLTRLGGDTFFGQGLAKRVFNFDNIPWDDLDTSEPNFSKNLVLNNNGRPEDQTSLWSLMYNLANPKSSYAYSLAQADAVVCTDWNAFDVTKQYQELITEAYHAPIYNPGRLSTYNLKTTKFLTSTDNTIDPAKGYYKYSGCIPFQ